jgi:hypothetical protein
MIDNLRAKPVRKGELKEDVFELRPNTPKLINKENNSHIAYLHEEKLNEGVDEHLYIHSIFHDEAYAIICNEFKLNLMDNAKTVDMSYYYFGTNNPVNVYLYDLKKTLSGIDVIYKLVLQWESSIEDSEYCVKKITKCELKKENIYLGVITENNDINDRNNNLNDLFQKVEISEEVPSSVQSKQRRNIANYIIMAKRLKGFDEGKVTIDGVTYEYDVREFVNQKHDMYFEDGQLKEDKAV